MHSSLIDFLKNRGLYFQSTINNLENSQCSENNSPVIDLLGAKDKYFGSKGEASRKSIIGLYVTPQDELLFIQPMKRGETFEDFIKKYSEHKLLNKVASTVDVMDDIIGYYGFHANFGTYLAKVKAPKIKTILLVDLSLPEYLKLRLAFGDELNIGTNNPITDDILIMTCEEFKKFYC
ncbi:MAG: hypothetical protein ABI581_04250 [Sediminibacterium sp.]